MSPQTAPDPKLMRMLDRAAQKYLAKLTDENHMEAFAQGKQREITLESFALVTRARPEVHCFNEILIQYPNGRKGKALGQVVPDNFVVLHPEPLTVAGHYSLQVQPARPFLVIEYVSKYNKRKDYEKNFRLYENGLKVPYYLLFYPDNEELTLFRMAGNRYEAVHPIGTGRLPIPELEVEVTLHAGWVRYWFRSELLPLPAALADARDEERAGRLEAERERAAALVARGEANARADAAERERDAANARAAALAAEVARMQEEMARLKGAG